MVKTDEVKYSDAERFDVDFKKRQSEIQSEISTWSQSESFRLKTRDIISTMMNDHDVLVSLSKRLFENGIFTASFKELTKSEMESTSHKTWIKRLDVLLWLILGVAIAWLGDFLLKKYC